MKKSNGKLALYIMAANGMTKRKFKIKLKDVIKRFIKSYK